ncbi:MAG: hypothetical protein GXO02_01250 [Epsilonproteobacteria bacterium]|nr:hypothetical protein [Campylobacterota bacterium]
MNPILLNINVIIYLISESILFIFILYAFLNTLYILSRWDFKSFTTRQYNLERRAYLIVTIISFIFIVKFFLLPFFVFTIDGLNTLVPGAMCAAGVISANSYGMALLFLKLLIIFFLIFWLLINKYDLLSIDYRFFKFKNYLFLLIAILFAIEIYYDFNYFLNIDISKPVSCCSTLFGQLEGANPLPFGLDQKMLLILFYLLFLGVIFSYFSNKILHIFFLILFLIISYYGVTYFFGTYIYELPTHKCPFCMLQKEYFYIGYLIWGSLFLGSFLGISANLIELIFRLDLTKYKKISILLLVIFTIIVSLYPLMFYLRNGVWL